MLGALKYSWKHWQGLIRYEGSKFPLYEQQELEARYMEISGDVLYDTGDFGKAHAVMYCVRIVMRKMNAVNCE